MQPLTMPPISPRLVPSSNVAFGGIILEPTASLRAKQLRVSVTDVFRGVHVAGQFDGGLPIIKESPSADTFTRRLLDDEFAKKPFNEKDATTLKQVIDDSALPEPAEMSPFSKTATKGVVDNNRIQTNFPLEESFSFATNFLPNRFISNGLYTLAKFKTLVLETPVFNPETVRPNDYE